MEAQITPDNIPRPVNHLTIKRWLGVVMSIFIIIWGIVGLLSQVYEIFIKYPDLFSSMLRSRNMATYVLLLQQVLFISLSNFITSAYGLAMLVKPSKVIKIANIIIMGLLVLITYYFNTNYQITPEILNSINLR